MIHPIDGRPMATAHLVQLRNKTRCIRTRMWGLHSILFKHPLDGFKDKVHTRGAGVDRGNPSMISEITATHSVRLRCTL